MKSTGKIANPKGQLSWGCKRTALFVVEAETMGVQKRRQTFGSGFGVYDQSDPPPVLQPSVNMPNGWRQVAFAHIQLAIGLGLKINGWCGV